jgi:hypothetical protein
MGIQKSPLLKSDFCGSASWTKLEPPYNGKQPIFTFQTYKDNFSLLVVRFNYLSSYYKLLLMQHDSNTRYDNASNQ